MVYKKKFNNKFFYSLSILIISLSVNQYFGYFGVNPIDNFTHYNSGYLILEKYVPFNDYWVHMGPLLDYLQAFFFKIFGINWSSYIFHASIFNFLFSIIIFFFFIKLGLNINLSFLFVILTALIFYPSVSTPFFDHHSIFFSISSVLMFILAINFKNTIYWLLIPFFLILGFFSKQTPSGYFFLLISFFYFYYLLIYKDYKSLLLLAVSSVFLISITYFLFYIEQIDFNFFFNQYLKFPSSMGGERISSGSFLEFSLSRYFLKFKLIHLSYLTLFFLLFYKMYKLKNYFLSIEFMTISIVIVSNFVLIFHQLLTLNMKFIYLIIPINYGFSVLLLKRNLKKNNIIIFLIFLCILSSIYNFNKYVIKRHFILAKNYDANKVFKTKIIDKKTNFNWITTFNIDPQKEVSAINESVKSILELEKNNINKFVIITDYQFIFSSFDIKNNIFINKVYGEGVSYPSFENINFNYYREYFLAKIKKNNVKKIYIIQPTWFNEKNFYLNLLFQNNCVSSFEIVNLFIIDLKECKIL